MKNKIRIGCGAGFSGDRIEPAIVLAEQGNLDYLVLECLAERTIALAQKRKMADPNQGYDPFLERRIETLLPHLIQNNITLITNMGAANPIAAAQKVIAIAKRQSIAIKVAAVYGDDVANNPQLTHADFFQFSNETFAHDLITNRKSERVLSANAYLGIEGILEALKYDIQVIITGRIADPSLFLAPMIHEFGWPTDDYDLMGKGTMIGHLLECAGHITGGYFADPAKKPVENMENLGHPFADIFADGSAIISKVAGTGGVVNLQTAKEQLLYEVVNPYEYYTPDVVADFTTVTLKEIAQNQVQVSGGTGKAKPSTYKVSVGYRAFWQGEGEISYYGPAALERAKLASETIQKRVKDKFDEIKIDLIGLNSISLNSSFSIPNSSFIIPKSEIRLRIAAKAPTQDQAALVGEEVEALYTNGPAGGGGVRKYTNEVIGIVSVLVDRERVKPQISLFSTTFHTFDTHRLLLKPTDELDADFILEMYNTPKWLRFIGDRNIHTQAAAADYINQKLRPQFDRLGFGNYVVIEKATQRKIGICGLYSRPELEGIDLGFAFLPDAERQGYGFESASKLIEVAKTIFQLSELSAITNLDNEASRKLLEKLGFTFKENRIIREKDEVTYYVKKL